jgi:hypothetical protein
MMLQEHANEGFARKVRLVGSACCCLRFRGHFAKSTNAPIVRRRRVRHMFSRRELHFAFAFTFQESQQIDRKLKEKLVET